MGSTGLNAGLARLFGLRLVSDIPERLCDLGLRPPLDAKRRNRLAAIWEAGLLFVHVPKNAGMAISAALYGRQIKHATARYYARVAPDLLQGMDSVAVIRDPVERFLSAYDYARAGGSADNRVSAPFRDLYMRFRSVDDALDHVESARSPYHMDHIFRPQAWYVTDAQGLVAVRRLVPFPCVGELAGTLGRGTPIPTVNCRSGPRTAITRLQSWRIRHLYREDGDLFDRYAGRVG